jgi:hypothetical protein
MGAPGDDEIEPIDAAIAHDAAVDHAVDHAIDHAAADGTSPSDATNDVTLDTNVVDAPIDAPSQNDGALSCTSCPPKTYCCAIQGSPNFGKCVWTTCLACCQ